MFELSREIAAIIEALRQKASHWQTPANLAKGLSLDLNQVYDGLCDLHVAGWVELKEDGSDVLVRLSPLFNVNQSLANVDAGALETTGRLHRDGNSQRRRRTSEPIETDRLVPETSRSEPVSSTRVDRLPLPSTLIGLSLVPWPGPISPDECPACGKGPLTAEMYCLYCDRWGLDSQLAEPTPDVPRSRRSDHPRNDSRFESENRAKRKLKHQRRLEKSPMASTQRPSEFKSAPVRRSSRKENPRAI